MEWESPHDLKKLLDRLSLGESALFMPTEYISDLGSLGA
jgi:hypothetical protein